MQHDCAAIDHVVAPVLEAVTRLGAAPEDVLGALSDEAIRRTVAALERAGSGLRAFQGRLVAEASRRQLDRADGCASPAAWLTATTGVSHAEAARRQHEALAVGTSPAVAQALASGAITPEHARVIGAATAEEPALDVGELLTHAATTDAGRFAARARQLRRAHDGDGGLSQYESQRRARRCSVHTRAEDGMVALTALLDPVDGGRVRGALLAMADAMWRAEQPGADVPATVRSHPQRLADALTALCTSAGRPNAGGRDVAVVVTVDHAELVSAETSSCTPAEVVGVGPIPVETARRLACEAGIVPMVLGGRGEVLDLGRSRRLASRAQRLALEAHHRHCAWPGCTTPFGWCQVHHRIPWERGGRTDLADLAPLCSRHHHLAHEGGWRLERAPGMRFTVHPPPGADPRGPT